MFIIVGLYFFAFALVEMISFYAWFKEKTQLMALVVGITALVCIGLFTYMLFEGGTI
jgi:hypothetical protein